MVALASTTHELMGRSKSLAAFGNGARRAHNHPQIVAHLQSLGM